YWASCLSEFQGLQGASLYHCFEISYHHLTTTGQFRFPAVERYINDLTEEMGEHLESITTSLTVFVEVGAYQQRCSYTPLISIGGITGVPTIRFAQKHTANSLQNLSTVATFFSAVTATTFQYSYQ